MEPQSMQKGKNQPVKRQPCEVYSRIVGYIRPVEQWGPAKKAEFQDRKLFKV